MFLLFVPRISHFPAFPPTSKNEKSFLAFIAHYFPAPWYCCHLHSLSPSLNITFIHAPSRIKVNVFELCFQTVNNNKIFFFLFFFVLFSPSYFPHHHYHHRASLIQAIEELSFNRQSCSVASRFLFPFLSKTKGKF